MARIVFTPNIQRLVECPETEAAGGSRLAFGSTTGGLWITEDQGDQWSNVTCTLPPIYAVRFA